MKTKCLIPLLDLTAHGDEDEVAIARLCKQAVTPFGRVASVVVPPQHIALARQTLNEHHGKSIAVATWLNQPQEEALYQQAIQQCSLALQAGAQEIEWYCPDDAAAIQQHLIALQALCLPYQALLKVALPQDESLHAEVLRWAQQHQIAFLRVAGKECLPSIQSAWRLGIGQNVGLKIQAGKQYSTSIQQILEWLLQQNTEALATAQRLRLGCSYGLLAEILNQLGAAGVSP